MTYVPASNLKIKLNESKIVEGSSTTLSGTFIAPGTLDPHDVNNRLGRRSTPTVDQLGLGITSFSGITHKYLDNPQGEPTGLEYSHRHRDLPSRAGMVLPHRPRLPSKCPRATPTVGTLPGQPTARSSAATPRWLGRTDQRRGFVILTGSYSDPGILDTHTVTVSWGDGTTSPAIVDPVNYTFTATHQYVYDKPGTSSSQDTISVTATDNDQASGSSAILLDVG